MPNASPIPIQPDFTDGYAERPENCYSGAVYEVLRAMGHPNQDLMTYPVRRIRQFRPYPSCHAPFVFVSRFP